MSLVTFELDEHVATITLNRPDARNAINGELRRDLNAAWDRFRDDEDAWVGILTANGDVFCAGGDLKDGEGSVGTFGGTFWEKPTINSFESGMEVWSFSTSGKDPGCLAAKVAKKSSAILRAVPSISREPICASLPPTWPEAP